MSKEKRVDWVASSLEDLKKMPEIVQRNFGYQLSFVQNGKSPASAKPLQGKNVKGVWELKANDENGTYRVMYIAKLKDAIYVLHCFKKKSSSGIKTPAKEMEIVENRLNALMKAKGH